MANVDQRNETEDGKKLPRVPIKTYRWEDVRRSRAKGGYPWTHLNKQPFDDEDFDPKIFIMDTRRRTKSSSPMNRVEISEISTESRKNSFNTLQVEMVQEPPEPDDQNKNQNSRNSIVIEEMEPDIAEETQSKENLETGSIGSSGNLSQYLDKEDRTPKQKTEEEEEEDRSKRAKSEEIPKRKRRLSAESSRSRISLSKLAIMKKLRDAKNKIKPPKLTKKTPQATKNKEPTREKKKHEEKQPETPVYIHIPLKPPEGETDEFSYLEFEEKKKNEENKLSTKRKEPLKINPAFRQLLKDVRQLKEVEKQPNEPEKMENEEIKQDEDKMEIDNGEKEEQMEIDCKEEEIIPKQEPKIVVEKVEEPIAKKKHETTSKNKEEEPKQQIEEEESKPQSKDENLKLQIEEEESKPQDTEEEPKHQKDEEDSKLQKEEDDSKPQIEEEEPKHESSSEEDVFERFFQSSATKSQNLTPEDPRQSRSKSEEPERKRRHSLESSYSRKSLSKLAIVKKLKNASEYIRSSLSRSGSKKKEEKKKTPKPKQGTAVKKETGDTPKNIEPVYIRIPLKPPEGQKDEFSHLEFEEKKIQEEPTKEPIENSPVQSESGVQFIFLTPPSDDEILDGSSDVPETPTKENTGFFINKIDELKLLARNAVNEISPHKLETVKEESPSERSIKLSTEDIATSSSKTEEEHADTNNKTEETDTLTIDVEDGLTEPPNNVIQEPKSSLKEDSSPVIKKKVSFKKRTSKKDIDDDYEDVQAPEDVVINNAVSKPEENEETDKTNQVSKLEIGQSMSTDEEKTYLDQKIIKDTSLEEDYNKWSKSNDHEYEPVCPPEEVTYPVALSNDTQTTPPTDQDAHRFLPSTTNLENSTLQFDQNKRNVDDAEKRPAMFHFHTDDEEPNEEKPTEIEQKQPGKLQTALKQKTEQIKTKFHNMKKPNLTLPKKPDLKKLKKFPKMPDTSKLHFHLPGRNKKPTNQRQLSTESNVGDTKKPIFNFGTYPRIFTKKNVSEKKKFATTPRKPKTDDRWSGGDSIRIPLHAQDSMDIEEEVQMAEEERRREETNGEPRESSPIRYDQHIDTEDEEEREYERENREIQQNARLNERWTHGSFVPREEEDKITDLDSPNDPGEIMGKDRYSSEGSVERKPGVLEEIDSDEFFLRQKGISQEYLCSELREAFRTPANALSQMQESGSFRSLQESQNKKKPIKKPKRKKTPHVSQEKISYDDESIDGLPLDGVPPAPPKRRSRRVKKQNRDDVVPYQETIRLDDEEEEIGGERLEYQRESLGILGDDERDEIDFDGTYENREMEGKEQPEIKITDPYKQFEFIDNTKYYQPKREEEQGEDVETEYRGQPAAPPRKHKSLKSLTVSENDSLGGYTNTNRHDFDTNDILRRMEDYIITQEETPIRPSRTRSRNSSISRTTPYHDTDSLQYTDEPPQSETTLPEDERKPCIEEPCVQDIRDYMGYAIIDKTKTRDPPLPPPRTPPRRKRSLRSTTASSSSLKFPNTSEEFEVRFSTVPRVTNVAPPVRPLRNYSTLRSIKKKPDPMYENKENMSQYIEMDDETNRDLNSGDIIQKMRDRPLPPPPRPPRKSRTVRQSLRDITSQENISSDPRDGAETVSTQYEQHETPSIDHDERLLTPSHYTYEEETVTHGSLIVEPLDGARILPESQLTNERIVPVTKEDSDEEETSEIPEQFYKLKNPETTTHQKLQVTDLDVDRLTVNQLMANQIIVSEIDASSIQTNEISSKSGTIRVGDIELPSRDVSKDEKKTSFEHEEETRQSDVENNAPKPPPRSYSNEEHPKDKEEAPEPEVDDAPPPRPPQPHLGYLPSQPPASFYSLRAQQYVDDIPMVPRRRKHQRSRRMSRSMSTSESSVTPVPARRSRRLSDASVPELAGRLATACGTTVNNHLKRLIRHLTENVLRNADGNQDIHVIVVILLVLIAGLILLGYGEEKTVVHLHHWEYFNPPKDM